jgi:hypothetical protein
MANGQCRRLTGLIIWSCRPSQTMASETVQIRVVTRICDKFNLNGIWPSTSLSHDTSH